MKPMLPYLIAFIVLDVVVTAVVLRRAFAKQNARWAKEKEEKSAGAPAATLPNWGALKSFTDDLHPRIGELVRMNWSGDSMSLPGVLAQALDLAERESRTRGLDLDRETLKKLVETSLALHHVAKGGVIREALKQVA